MRIYRSILKPLRALSRFDVGPQRSLSSNVKEYVRPPLTKVSLENPLPDLPHGIYLKTPKIEGRTQVTTLSNGLRVASEPQFGQFCTVGESKNLKNQDHGLYIFSNFRCLH